MRLSDLLTESNKTSSNFKLRFPSALKGTYGDFTFEIEKFTDRWTHSSNIKTRVKVYHRGEFLRDKYLGTFRSKLVGELSRNEIAKNLNELIKIDEKEKPVESKKIDPKIQQIIDDHLLFKKNSTTGEFADFSNMDLTDANLSGLDLGGVKFVGANLTNANLSKCFLYGAKFDKADLSGASLVGANGSSIEFTNCIFKNANFDKSRFENCNFDGSNFDSAKLSNVNFNRSKMTNCIFTNVDFGKSNVTEVNFRNSKFDKKFLVDIFQNAKTDHADFRDTPYYKEPRGPQLGYMKWYEFDKLPGTSSPFDTDFRKLR